MRLGAVGVLVGAGLVVLACGTTSPSSGAGGASGAPQYGQGPARAGASWFGGVNASDVAYCQAMQARAQRCGSPSSSDMDRCVRQACGERFLWGDPAVEEVRHCRASHRCGSLDGCEGAIARRTQLPSAQAFYARCAAWVSRCGQGSRRDEFAVPSGKSMKCAVAASLRDEIQSALQSCFDQACDLGHMCTYGAIADMAPACGKE